MSVDPLIQSPSNSQSINPYSYIMNNPMAGTDPTGYKAEDNDVCNGCGMKKDEQNKNIYETRAGSRIKIKIGSVTTTTLSNASDQIVAISQIAMNKNGSWAVNITNYNNGKLDKMAHYTGSTVPGAQDPTQTSMNFGSQDQISTDKSRAVTDSNMELDTSWYYQGACASGLAHSPSIDTRSQSQIDKDLKQLNHLTSIAIGGFSLGSNLLRNVKNTIKNEKPSNIERLPNHIAATFSGGKYTSKVLEKDIILFRAGTLDAPLGQFFSKDKPISEIQARIDKAILPIWPDGGKSPIDTVFKIRVPAGTTIHTGRVASQPI